MKAKEFASGGYLAEISEGTFATIWTNEDSVVGGYGANQGFVVLEESVLVYDTGMTLRQAKFLDQSIKKETDKKVRYVVNSHDHSDHVFGNSFFSKRYSTVGLRIIAHDNCKSRLRELGNERIKGYRKIPEVRKLLESLEIKLPNVTYTEPSLGLKIEGTELVFVHPSTGAHTLGDTLLCMPKKRVLFAGDIIWNSFLPNLEDANLEGWIDILEDLDYGTYKTFLPGHGDICSQKEVETFAGYLKQVRENLRKKDGLDPAEIESNELRKCFEIPGTESWRLRLFVDHNIKAMFGSISN